MLSYHTLSKLDVDTVNNMYTTELSVRRIYYLIGVIPYLYIHTLRVLSEHC